MAESVPELLFGRDSDKLVQLIANFYTVESNGRLNRYTLSLVKYIVADSQYLKLESLLKLRIVANTSAIIHSMQVNEQTDSLEIMLEILFCLLDTLNE